MIMLVGVQLLKMPTGWSFTQGAAFLVQSLTAYYGLKSLGNIQVAFAYNQHYTAGKIEYSNRGESSAGLLHWLYANKLIEC